MMKTSFMLGACLSALTLVQFLTPAHSASTAMVNTTVVQETPATIVLGEPIIIHAHASLLTTEPVALLLGVGATRNYPVVGEGTNLTTWYHVTLMDSAGNTVPAVPDPSHPITNTSHPSFELSTLETNDYVDEYYVVSSHMMIQRPGSYTLNVHVSLPYKVASDYAQDLTVLTSPSSQKIDHDYIFPIVIEPKDAAKLRATAAYLCKQIETSNDDALRIRALAEALFAMPEAEASKSWVTLGTLNRGDLNGNEFLTATNLAYHPSPKASDILAYMAWQVPLPDNLTPEKMLRQMYNIADAPLKQHIRHLFMEHGMSSVPDEFPMAQISN